MSRQMVTIKHPNIDTPVTVPASAVKHHEKSGWKVVDSDTAPEQGPADYSSLKKAELEAEVERRNSERTPDSQVVVDGNGTVEDLRSALIADDQR